MGEKNFMEASTEISGYISKIDQCHNKIASLLAEACISRGKSGKTSSLEHDIMSAIKDLPESEQNIVLRKLAVIIVSSFSGKQSNSFDSGRKTNNIFANRNFN